MSIKSTSQTDYLKGHRERLRKRLEVEPLAVADYEVMELLLGLAITRKDTKTLAHILLDRFGGIRGALDARPDELLQTPGFGPSLINLWRLIREIFARYAAAPLQERHVLASSEAVSIMARQRLANLPNEESWLALVDAQKRMISWLRLRQGGIRSIALQPRDVFEAALLHKADGIILCHNHPGGNPLPSNADIELTNKLIEMAPHLDLDFIDHIIVTAGDCYSICQKRLLHILGGNNA